MHALLHSVPPTLQQDTSDPCLHCILLDTQGHVWISLLWGSFLGPGALTVLCVPSKSLFPQSCVSFDGSVVGLMVTSSMRAYAISRSTASRAPTSAAVQCWPVPLQETLKHSSVSVSVGSLGPGTHKVCLSPLYRPWKSLGQNTGVGSLSLLFQIPESSQHRDWIQVSRIAGEFFTSWATREGL